MSATSVLGNTGTLDQRASRIERELLSRRADVVHHGRWSLHQHLVGTFEILDQWDLEAYVRLAGLLHSAYSTDVFASCLFARDEREFLRSIAGPDAERLAFHFCAIDRRTLFARLQTNGGDVSMPITLQDRGDGAALTLSQFEVGDLLLVHMANLAEQVCSGEGAPSPWLADFAQLAAWAKGRVKEAPPVLDRCTAHVARENERVLISAYEALLQTPFGQHREAERALSSAVEAVPWVAEPYIWLGLHALAAGDATTASAFGERAAKTLISWNTAWDKRLSAIQWLGLASFLRAAGTLDDAGVAFRSQRLQKMLLGGAIRPTGMYLQLESLGALGAPTVVDPTDAAPHNGTYGFNDFVSINALPSRYTEYIAGLHVEGGGSTALYPGLTAQPFWDAQIFQLVQDLENNAPAIIAEFRAIDPQLFQSESERIGRTGHWNVFLLFENGKKRQERCDLLPVTTRIVESHRTVRTRGGLVYFSRLAPGTTVAPHRGPSNMRVRCHLGIDVPDRCGMIVGGIPTTWHEGKCIVFDDSYVHDVWNESQRERVVLIVDLWHPDLSDEEVTLISGFQTHVARAAEALTKYWANNETAPHAIMDH